MPTSRTNFLDVDFDVLTTGQLLSRMAATGMASPYAYLVTPNVDHLVRLRKLAQQVPGLRQAYQGADICVCDSQVLSRLARWRGIDLPVTAGSDLTEMLFKDVIRPGDRIAILGGSDRQLAYMREHFPGVEFVQHCPPLGLLRNAGARTKAAEWIAAQRARFTFVCVGSPQQELIAAEAARIDGARGIALCVGAALDFITGHQRRAPILARRLSLEWAHRLLTNPRRLWKRYLVEGPRIFLMAARWPGKSPTK